ncbi:MAG: hypothetical protein AAFO79_07235 [Pseudomonadota bacterium]
MIAQSMRSGLALVAAGALSLMFAAAPALTTSAQARTLAGTWNGSGSATTKSGKRERVRCRVRYSGSGRSFRLSGRCAGTSGSTSFSGRVSKTGPRSFSGSARSAKYGVNAGVSVSLSSNGRRQTIFVSSPRGSARVSLRK